MFLFVTVMLGLGRRTLRRPRADSCSARLTFHFSLSLLVSSSPLLGGRWRHVSHGGCHGRRGRCGRQGRRRQQRRIAGQRPPPLASPASSSPTPCSSMAAVGALSHPNVLFLGARAAKRGGGGARAAGRAQRRSSLAARPVAGCRSPWLPRTGRRRRRGRQRSSRGWAAAAAWAIGDATARGRAPSA
ncbi:hypothetical protein PVAP13_6KG396518 [Panicum virgatum]|uniref:Uncharacterized protein n=1 Tax=Panicum virgatum TaxID=38727 RepID=A0A8T0RIV7_PANVG|nr:hypothetical protein PVAP13_6KG396518 [Panicum virgatum]